MITRVPYRFFSTHRYFSVMSRDNADFTSKILKRMSPKHEQKPLGKYPIPPEDELLWKNRKRTDGGYFQHSISAYQLKFVYPTIHQAPARLWAKISQGFWWVFYPVIMTYVAVLAICKISDLHSRRHGFY